MSAFLVFLVYAGSVALALLLLYAFHAKAWYWHLLSVLLALAVGSVPTPPEWKNPAADLLIGFVFLFLLIWGLGAPLFRTHHPRHA